MFLLVLLNYVIGIAQIGVFEHNFMDYVAAMIFSGNLQIM